MEHQAVLTFHERYDMQENAATIIRLFERISEKRSQAAETH
jgi:hypothetical protein